MKSLRPYQVKALASLSTHNKGIVIIPTGGGKTLIFMEDIKRRISQSETPLTIVIVAPKILLSSQLSNEFEGYLKGFSNVFQSHIHSGEDGITDPSEIITAHNLIQELNYHHLMFTTYKSLPRIHEAGIDIDVAIFDEAHHSVFESNFVGVAQTSETAKNSFFFTATPKHTDSKTTMANSSVYGGTILSIPPKELVSSAYILPPQVETYEASETDDVNIINFIDNIEYINPKILVAVPSTQKMMDMFTETELLNHLQERGFNVFHITSKYGCVVNNVQKTRVEFFEELSRIGNDDNEKLIIFHFAILSEGISIEGLSHALLLRNLSIVDYVQTIGRILRLHREDSKKLQEGTIKPGEYHLYKKPCGVIAFPTNDSRGSIIQRRLQSIVNTLFIEGKTLVA
jgi:superfamily II DNA or RNA helicase